MPLVISGSADAQEHAKKLVEDFLSMGIRGKQAGDVEGILNTL